MLKLSSALLLFVLIMGASCSQSDKENKQDDGNNELAEIAEENGQERVMPGVLFYGDSAFLKAYDAETIEMLARVSPSKIYLQDGIWRIQTLELGIGYLGGFGEGESSNYCLFDIPVDSAINYTSGSFSKYLSWLEVYESMKSNAIKQIVQKPDSKLEVFISDGLNLFSKSQPNIRLSDISMLDVFKEEIRLKMMVENLAVDGIEALRIMLTINEFPNDSSQEAINTFQYEDRLDLKQIFAARQKLFAQVSVANKHYRPAAKALETRYYKDEKSVFYKRVGEEDWVQIEP